MKINMNQTPEKEPATKNMEFDKTKKIKQREPVTDEIINEEITQTNKDNDHKKSLKNGGLFRTNKFWIGVCITLFIILLSVNSNMSRIKTQLTIQLRNVTSDTADIQGAIDEIKARLDEQAKIDVLTLTEEETEEAYNNAVEQGDRVAELQNAYKKLNSYNTPDKYNDNVNALDAFFDDDSKNARVTWYGYNDFIPGTWEFASKASFKGNTARVLWLCYADEDNKLLSYCIATYNADTKLFSGVEYKLTKYVEFNVDTDETESSDKNIPLIDPNLLDSLKALGEEDTSETDDEGKPDKKTVDTNNKITTSRESLKETIKNSESDGKNYDKRYDIGIDEGGDDDENDIE